MNQSTQVRVDWFNVYFPLNERETAGPWELIPVRDFKAEDVNAPGQVEPVQGLVTMYRLPDGRGNLGVLARPRDGKVGDAIDRVAMGMLGRAILLALLDTNPSFLTPEEERTGNEGHAAVTSDNAIGYGHPLEESGHIAVEYGALATTLTGGLNVHEQEGMIPFRLSFNHQFSAAT